ncbi:unnamed protein product [Cochlearia groenlandica]
MVNQWRCTILRDKLQRQKQHTVMVSEMGITFAAKLRFRSMFRSSAIDSYCFACEAFSDPISFDFNLTFL